MTFERPLFFFPLVVLSRVLSPLLLLYYVLYFGGHEREQENEREKQRAGKNVERQQKNILLTSRLFRRAMTASKKKTRRAHAHIPCSSVTTCRTQAI